MSDQDTLNAAAVAEEPTQEVSGAGLTDVVAENITYAVTKDKNGRLGFAEYKDGNSTFIAINGGKNADGTDKEPSLELLHKVDVSVPYIHSLAGISQVVSDEEEAVSIFNKGAQQKITTKLRSYFTEANETGDLLHTDETTFDATEFLAEPMKRRSMTDTQKAVKVLKGISAESLAEALRSMGIIS